MKRIIFICMAIVMLLGTTAFGAQEENVIQINEGTSRDEVHRIIGEAESVSVEGYREVYTLETVNQRLCIIEMICLTLDLLLWVDKVKTGDIPRFLLFYNFLISLSKPQQPSYISLYVVSKSPVYHGSKTSEPMREEKSNILYTFFQDHRRIYDLCFVYSMYPFR